MNEKNAPKKTASKKVEKKSTPKKTAKKVAPKDSGVTYKIEFHSGYCGGDIGTLPVLFKSEKSAQDAVLSLAKSWASYATYNNNMGGCYRAVAASDAERSSIKGNGEDSDMFDGFMHMSQATAADLKESKVVAKLDSKCSTVVGDWFKELADWIRGA